MMKNNKVTLYSGSGAVIALGVQAFAVMFCVGLVIFGGIKLLAFILEKLPHYKGHEDEDNNNKGEN